MAGLHESFACRDAGEWLASIRAEEFDEEGAKGQILKRIETMQNPLHEYLEEVRRLLSDELQKVETKRSPGYQKPAKALEALIHFCGAKLQELE